MEIAADLFFAHPHSVILGEISRTKCGPRRAALGVKVYPQPADKKQRREVENLAPLALIKLVEF
jgi:hypothetical protein